MADEGQLCMSDLWARQNFSSAAGTGHIDRLQKTNLVRREEHPHDRRKWVITLTAAGRKKIDDLFS
jgi:DNA-binding MarR family transcriptional regulator